MSTPIWTVCGSAYSSVGSDAVYGRPVISMTSSARTVRRPFSTEIRSAASGSSLAQPGVQRGRPDLGELGLQPAPDRRVGAGELEPVHDRAGVERRAADQHRGAPGAAELRDRRPRPPLELRDRRRVADGERVEQVVRDAAALGDRQLRRTDVHAAVDLHRVGVHDLAAEPLGEVERQAGLAGRGRADDGHDRGGWRRLACG